MQADFLTDRQAQVLKFIRDYSEECRMPPTRADIAKHFGWASPNAAECHVQALRNKGCIEILGGKARGIRVIWE